MVFTSGLLVGFFLGVAVSMAYTVYLALFDDED